MHILLILHPSGLKIPIRTQLAEVFGTYLSKKHKISVLLFSKKNKDYKWKGIHIYEIKYSIHYGHPIKSLLNFKYLINFIKKFKKIISNEKVDLVFGRNVYVIGNLFYYPISKILKTPFVLQLTFPIRYIVEASFLRKHLLLFIFKRTIKIAELILPISHWMGRYIQKVWEIDNLKIFNFPDGVNVEKFSSLFYKNNYKNREKYSLIYIGNLYEKRKLDFLIKVMRLVVDKIPLAKLLIVGDGMENAKLINLTKQLDLTQNVKFFGHVHYSQIPKYLNLSSIGVSPIPPTLYFKLSSPLKLFEYMGAGLAIVANEEILEQKKVLSESKGGKLVPYDIEKFANAIIELLSHEAQLIEMGKKNITWVNKHRNYEHLASLLEKKLINLIKSGKT